MNHRRVSVFLVALSLVAAACAGTDETTPQHNTSSAIRERFGTLHTRTLDIRADGRNTTAAIASMNAFAIDLYREVTKTNHGNVVLSPYSATFALSMIYAGARGATADEMAKVLHVDTATNWHEGINAYDLSLNARTTGGPTQWAAANKVWTQPGLALVNDYLDVLTGSYGAPLAETDFATGNAASTKRINDWVATQTSQRIPQLFDAGVLGTDTQMVLANAVALDAPWEFPFDPAATATAPFRLLDGTTVDEPMMHYNEFLGRYWSNDIKAVEIPYAGGALSMVVIMPTDLAAFEASLTPAALQSVIANIGDGGIHLALPRWTTRTHQTLNETLQALGMVRAFGGDADFSGMIAGGGLHVSRVEHEAYVEVDEAGTRAAAASAGAMAGSHGPTITFDKPYLYVIRDKGAGNILFIGRVVNPLAG